MSNPAALLRLGASGSFLKHYTLHLLAGLGSNDTSISSWGGRHNARCKDLFRYCYVAVYLRRYARVHRNSISRSHAFFPMCVLREIRETYLVSIWVDGILVSLLLAIAHPTIMKTLPSDVLES